MSATHLSGPLVVGNTTITQTFFQGARLTLTDAIVKNLTNTTQILVPAAPAGCANVLVGIYADIDTTAGAYVEDVAFSDISVFYSSLFSATPIVTLSFSAVESGNTQKSYLTISNTGQVVPQDAIVIGNAEAPWAGGNAANFIKFTPYYVIIPTA